MSATTRQPIRSQPTSNLGGTARQVAALGDRDGPT